MLTFKKCIKEFAEVLQSKRKEMLKDDDIINDEFNTNTSDDAQCSKNGKIVQYQRYLAKALTFFKKISLRLFLYETNYKKRFNLAS